MKNTAGQEITKPAGVSKYLWNDFVRCFSRGCEFWTSEDGDLMAIVIMDREDFANVLTEEFKHRFDEFAPLDPTKIQYKHLQKEWAGADFYDGGFPRRGKIWRIVNHETPYPALVYNLEQQQHGETI